MKFSAVFALLLSAYASAQTASYDFTYDNGGSSLTSVACSDGPNGLITRGYSTFGSLPGFPRIGGVPAVTGWNSPACGSCWELTYTPPNGAKRSINIIAVDVGRGGFNLAHAALNDLTNGQATQLGRVNVAARQVAPSACGLWFCDVDI
ncbi:snodprot1 [Coprinopsis cinerea okayama7|uniref:Snodprot1 n=1 Tax=Coprinopsis cinerea (strain Okayama-7 / 130 / ATCC MYA-4618 / FGSC 9003) TaxID=240176 RepID=A8P9R6_COPC7|nr:snodprot1 [Coprinopsis cinerea okayama7\|eukprot:XP_001839821.2 snodprot1 [Coprinopsis cinerea okayama7\